MAKTLFAISAAAFAGVFRRRMGVSRTQAGVAEATVQIDTFQLMTNAKQMPAEHFADYSFVY